MRSLSDEFKFLNQSKRRGVSESFCYNPDTEIITQQREMLIKNKDQPATDLIRRKRKL